MAEPEQTITTNDLQRQITALGVRMEHGFDEVKELFSESEKRLRALETREAGCQPIVTARIDAAWREIEAHKIQMAGLKESQAQLTKTVDRVDQSLGLIKWFSGLTGGAVILWLLGRILGLIA